MGGTPIHFESGATYKKPTIYFFVIRSVEHFKQLLDTFIQGK